MKQFLNLAGKAKTNFTVSNKVVGGKRVAEVMCHGPVGDYYGSPDDITAPNFKAKLDACAPFDSILCRVSSPGGDSFEGVAIRSMLNSYGKHVHVHVDGLAASAAATIASGGHKVTMSPGSLLMIHNASMPTYGNAKQLRDDADVLDKVSNSIADCYVDKTGLPKEKVQKMMDNETWMSAKDCVRNGFADEEGDLDGEGYTEEYEARVDEYKTIAASVYPKFSNKAIVEEPVEVEEKPDFSTLKAELDLFKSF